MSLEQAHAHVHTKAREQELPVAVGDAAYDDFYRRERAPLVRLAHLLTGSAGVGEELAQEALLAVHRQWDGLDNPAGYARRALVNLSRSYQRRRVLEWRHGSRHRAEHQPPPGLPPDVDETWTAIRGLSPQQRAVVVLRFYEDLPLDDIARLLDQPVGTVKSSLHRALARLKEVLS